MGVHTGLSLCVFGVGDRVSNDILKDWTLALNKITFFHSYIDTVYQKK
jgi:hypothetical protein